MRSFLHKILVIISLVFSTSLLIAYLAPLISPEKFWPPAFFGLAYPYLLVINITFVIYWILRRRLSFLLPLIAIIIGYSHLGRFINLGSKQDSPPKKAGISLISYNIRYFDKYKWTKDPKTPNNIISLIEDTKSGIVCLQEFRRTSTGTLSTTNLRKKFRTPYFHIDPKSGNIATFSRYPIVKRGQIPFTKEHLCTCIYSDIKVGPDTLRIFNIHLESNRFVHHNYKFITQKNPNANDENLEEIKDISTRLRYGFIRRAQQVDIISKYIKDSPYPTILCGDFNDTPSSYTYHKMSQELIDAFQTRGRGIGTTYNGAFPSFRIDYILYHPSIICAQYKRIKKKYSDHYPIYGKFAIAK